jgi:hypothetical protein
MASRLRRAGPELLIESWVNEKRREMHFREYWWHSGNGETLTMQHRDDDLAGETTILEKALEPLVQRRESRVCITCWRRVSPFRRQW